MTNKELDASGFEDSELFWRNEFFSILNGVITCYNRLVSSGIVFNKNIKENDIRDRMLDGYLKKQAFKESNYNLQFFHFDAEAKEDHGKTDIRILPIKNYVNDNAYYIIECKLLKSINPKGISGLNAKYVKDGICRFTTNYYSSYYSLNGMIGFVIDNMNIDENVKNINFLLDKDFVNDKKRTVNARPLRYIAKVPLTSDFEFSYSSSHQVDEQKTIDLFHLMFNFSNNINPD